MSRIAYPRLTLYDPESTLNQDKDEYERLGLFNLLYALENNQFPMV